jgi:hypothetical protein
MQPQFDFGRGSNEHYVDEHKELIENSELIRELIPSQIESLKYNGSEYIPLIFCALVIRRFQRFENSQGTDITNIINEFIVKEGSKKESTNVSRALRSANLIGQKWLRLRKDIYPKFNAFSLNEKWEEQWLTIFGELPKL